MHQFDTVVLLATADWNTPYKTNKQLMAKQFAIHGVKVLYFESPGLRKPNLNSGRDWKRIFTRMRRWLSPPELVLENIWVCSPLQIPFFRKISFIAFVNTWLLSHHISRALKSFDAGKLLFWSYFPFDEVLVDKFKPVSLVYHCVDDLSSVPGVDAIAFEKSELRFLNVVDVVFVTHQNLASKFEGLNSQTFFLPNAVDLDSFMQSQAFLRPSQLPPKNKPIIGFHGSFSDFKVDFKLILELAISRKDWNFVLIGNEREGQRDPLLKQIFSLNNVFNLGFIAPEELPKFVNQFNVGILPLLLNGYTANMFPMKYYEYVAARVPVVSTNLDFFDGFDGPFFLASNASEMEKGIEKALKLPKLTIKEARSIIGENTYSSRFKNMMRILERTT